MAPKTLLTREDACQILRYAPPHLIWKRRPRSMFKSDGDWRKWNTRYAGKIAGGLDAYGRVVVGIGDALHFAHRLVWLIVRGEPVPRQIDHKDTDPSNNSVGNLRAATNSQNKANARKLTTNTSGYKGAYLHRCGRFAAQIQHNRKNYYLGLFDTPQAAHAAYCEAADRLFGEFSRHS